jgi:hypothetical protein
MVLVHSSACYMVVVHSSAYLLHHHKHLTPCKWSIRARAHERFQPPWIERTNVHESGCTSDQFTAAVLNTQPASYSWRSGGCLDKWNKWLCAIGRPYNRSGVFSVLCSTPSIGSSLPPSSCCHNDCKQWKWLLWRKEVYYWSGEKTNTYVLI